MSTTNPERIVVPLDDDECRTLLLAGRIGRLVFTRKALPAIQPVLYQVRDDEVVIPALPDSPFLPSSRGAVVAFSVDSYGDCRPVEWSVTVVGPLRAVDRPAEAAAYEAFPWAFPTSARGRRYVAVRIGLLSGWRTEPRLR